MKDDARLRAWQDAFDAKIATNPQPFWTNHDAFNVGYEAGWHAREAQEQPLLNAAIELWRADEAAQGMTQSVKEGQERYDIAIRALLAARCPR